MKIYFEKGRGPDVTQEFPDFPALYRHIDQLEKENSRDPYKRRQVWAVRNAETMERLASWSPHARKFEVFRQLGSETPLF